MYLYSTYTSFHFTIDSLRNICSREEEKKENGEERTWWRGLKRWNIDGKDGYLSEWKKDFKWKGKKSYGGTNCSNTANLKRRRGGFTNSSEDEGESEGAAEARTTVNDRQRKRDRGANESSGKVAGEIREWQDGGLNDGGGGWGAGGRWIKE